MHVVLDARILGTTTGRYAEMLVVELCSVAQDISLTVIIDEHCDESVLPERSRLRIIKVSVPHYSVREQTTLLRLLNRLDADLVHFLMPQQPILYHRPHVTTFHDLTLLKTRSSDRSLIRQSLKQSVGMGVFRIAARTSRALLVPSEYTKKDLVNYTGAREERIVVTPYAGGYRTCMSENVSLPFSRFLLYVGGQSDYKNVDRLAQAHQALRRDLPELGLVLAGTLDSRAEANRKRFALKRYEGIVFTNRVSDEQLTWLYENCDAYVFPSLMEGFGLPGIEAMEQGAPVVSSNRTCLPEVYGNAASYFDPLNLSSMTEAIRRVITDTEVRQALIRAGSERATGYSWKETAEKTAETYRRALGPAS